MTTAVSGGDLARIVPEGTTPPVGIPPAVFSAAHRSYRTGRRVDMQALARRARVGRATLYRRVGNREQLLDQLIWWHARHALTRSVQAAQRKRGVERIVAVIDGLLRAVESDAALHAFLRTDPDVALRILTGARSAVQRGVAGVLERTIDLEVERGHFTSTLDTPALAYAISRIGEGFLYADVIADREPDVEHALTVIAALLRGLDRGTA